MKMQKKVFLIVALVFGGPFFFTCEEASGKGGARSKVEAIHVGGKVAFVEFATTPQQRMRGLMYREKLETDHGMLFIFPRVQPLSFWMKNTLIPLDVGFFDARHRLLNVRTMLPDNGKTIHSSIGPAVYALEMNAGWFKKRSIPIGAKLVLPHPITSL